MLSVKGGCRRDKRVKAGKNVNVLKNIVGGVVGRD